MAKRPDREGFNRRDFENAMHALTSQKRIRLEKAKRTMAWVACEPPAPTNPFYEASEAA
jgi:hypothetical protein